MSEKPMSALFTELSQQPQAFRGMLESYTANCSVFDLPDCQGRIILTGMGASFHAAWIAAIHLNHWGVPAMAMEATNLCNYAPALLRQAGTLVYISQSGTSGEVPVLLDLLDNKNYLVAVTNNPESELARKAQVLLPMLAGEEELIASKTYINTLAILWLLARRAGGAFDGSETDTLYSLAGRIESIIRSAPVLADRLVDTFDVNQPLNFLGHGPHAVTARQAAMMLSEWSKVPALNAGIGAYRHGFIEAVKAGSGALVFAAPGGTSESAIALARELQCYNVRVLLSENGLLRAPDESPARLEPLDEFLSPVLDILPVQLYTEALQRALGFEPGFRYIRKVVTQL
jgi:glucosamine--fructose-6-phosphate aminotransferase (isomerizing)